MKEILQPQSNRVQPRVLSFSLRSGKWHNHLTVLTKISQFTELLFKTRAGSPNRYWTQRSSLSKVVEKIRLQIKFWARHDFAARSCCDLGLQGSNPNVACDTSQHEDHLCEIVFK